MLPNITLVICNINSLVYTGKHTFKKEIEWTPFYWRVMFHFVLVFCLIGFSLICTFFSRGVREGRWEGSGRCWMGTMIKVYYKNYFKQTN